jgi:hypothetical protein
MTKMPESGAASFSFVGATVMLVRNMNTDKNERLTESLVDANRYLATYILAGNPNTPEKMIFELSQSDDPRVRRRVAENERISGYLLQVLSHDTNGEVRTAVADNPKTPSFVLRKLAMDEDADVRYALAENVQAPLFILNLLSEDENPYVCARAVRTINRRCSQIARIVPLIKLHVFDHAARTNDLAT